MRGLRGGSGPLVAPRAASWWRGALDGRQLMQRRRPRDLAGPRQLCADPEEASLAEPLGAESRFTSQALLVSTLALTLPSGVLASANIATASLDAGAERYALALPPGVTGAVYVQLITLSMQGCGGPGQSFTQSAPSDVLVVALP